MRVTERVHVGDVLVIGAGVVGLMLARELTAIGRSVCLVDREAAGGHQSNHSHGYLHRGHIYHAPDPDLVRALCAGADRWRAEFADAGVVPETERSVLGYTNPQDARSAADRWREHGLDVRPCTPGESPIDPVAVPHQFSTDEPAYDVTGWLRHTLETVQASGGVTLRGRVTDIVREGTTVTGVRTVLDGCPVELVAGSYAVVAGTGNGALARSALGRGGMFQNRRCHMAVIGHPELTPFAFVTPDHRLRGLFGATRTRGTDTVLLASDYQAFAPGSDTDLTVDLWFTAIQRVVLRALPWLDDSETRIGAYLAEKGEVRRRRAVLNHHAADDLGLDNLLVGSPSKLTLCPLLVDEMLGALRRGPTVPVDDDALRGRPGLDVAPETWTRVGLEPLPRHPRDG